jgi:hypothetical protein
MTAALTDETMARVVDALPDEWLASDPAFSSAAEQRAAYLEWLRARRGAVPVFLEEAQRARMPL